MTSPWADPAELQRRLAAAAPGVLVLPEREIRRILRRLDAAGDPRPWNSRRAVRVPADKLVHVDWDQPDAPPGGLFAVAAADDLFPAGLSGPQLLREYWRLLFREAVERAVRGRPAAAALLKRLPPAVVREARFVLEFNAEIRPHADDDTLAATFAAVFLDLIAFDPDHLRFVFPTIENPDTIAAILGSGIDIEAVKTSTRPAGDVAEDPATAPDPAPSSRVPPGDTAALRAAADRDIRRGNFARAAVRRTFASDAGGAETALRDGIIAPLARVFGWAADQAEVWYRAVAPLAPAAAGGYWSPAAKALYDLQRLAAELDGKPADVAPVEWVLSAFRRPLTRSLESVRDVLLLRHLARIAKHVRAAGLAAADRDLLADLLAEEAESAEVRTRKAVGPRVHAALDAAGLREADLPERVARGKLVGELLDAVCDRGYLRFSDFRDAVARNSLKMTDLVGPVELVRGDALLKADRLLADALPGVYRGGEVYLRSIHRFSSVAFGTPAGRFLTLYAALPFGGAFLFLEFLQHILHAAGKGWAAVEKAVGLETPEVDVEEYFDAAGEFITSAPPEAHAGAIVTLPAVAAVGLVILALLHSPGLRRAAGSWLCVVGGVLRRLFVTAPIAVWNSGVVRAVRSNFLVRFVSRNFGPAAAVAGAAAAVMALAGASPGRVARWSATVFAVVFVVANTTRGRRWLDGIAEAGSDAWRAVWANLLPGVVGWVAWFFHEVAAGLERGLYAVDEHFRYREGATRRGIALRAAGGLVWFPVAYVVRFAFYLLLEPQVNPLKHFPVVTVSHKVLLPLVKTLADTLHVSLGLATAVISCIPGVFGFLVWEFKANWKLYAANRSEELPPVPIGHHGETVRGLLRPGFHSGTLPKLFRKLRSGCGNRTRLEHDLRHVELAVKRLAERDIFPYWAAADVTDGLAPRVAAVHAGCRRVRVDIDAGANDDGRMPLILSCEYQPADDKIEARIESWGWAGPLRGGKRAAVVESVRGFFAAAAADPPGGEGRPTWDQWRTFWAARGK